MISHIYVLGKLENGFTYFILPNSNPPGRFEAHLEVLSGSANELDRQQGMAHLIEHVAYMGSPKVSHSSCLLADGLTLNILLFFFMYYLIGRSVS